MELLSRNGKDMSLSRFVPGGKLGHRGKKLTRLGYGQALGRTHFNPGEKLGRLGLNKCWGEPCFGPGEIMRTFVADCQPSLS